MHEMSDTNTDQAYDLVKGLRVTRAYTAEDIAEEDKLAILEAGRWTGSSKNRQAWKLLSLVDESGRVALAECGYYTQPVRDAAWVLALVRTAEGNDFDIGRLAQNLMLAAATKGIGSCPVTLHKDGCATKVLGLQDGESARWVIAFGYPDREAEAQMRQKWPYGGRKPLSEIVDRPGDR